MMPYKLSNTMITGKADPEKEHRQKWIKPGKTIKQGLNYRNEIAGLRYEKQAENTIVTSSKLSKSYQPNRQICPYLSLKIMGHATMAGWFSIRLYQNGRQE